MTEATNNASGPVAWQLQLPDGRVTLEKAFPLWAAGNGGYAIGDGYTITPLYTAPPAAAVVPQWLRSKEAFANQLHAAGWRDHADAQWSGVESLRTELLARLNPAPVEQRAMVVPEGYVLVPAELIEHVKHARKMLGSEKAPLWERQRLAQTLTDLLATPTPEPVSPDWPGGNYYCKCSVCRNQFTGHKRQLVCRLCAEQPAKEQGQ